MSTNEATYDVESGRESTNSIVLSAAPDPVEVRRNGGLAAMLGGAASAVAIGYLARAVASGSILDWGLAVVLGLLGGYYLYAFVDARTPLLVADTQGVRIRLGRAWRGIPWSGLATIEVAPRGGFARDGRLTLVPRNPEKVLASFDGSGRRQGRIAARLYGSAFAMPLGLSTRVTGTTEDLTTSLRQLAGGGARVVELVADQAAAPVEVVETAESTEPTGRRITHPGPVIAHAISLVSDGLKSRADARSARRALADADRAEARAVAEAAAAEAARPIPASPTPSPLREARAPRRAEITSTISDQATTEPVVGRHMHRAGSVDLVEEKPTWADRVRPLARVREAVEPIVIDDFAVQPAAEPVIGPDLKAARTRIGLSVEQLAERTRIRPHVIESIEVDDFVPCGGDFYARGHLRTLARILGLDVEPLLATYDERYADAEINPRRVFEAELASGSTSSLRAMRGGPNWSILVAAVMAVVLAWSIARLVMADPVEVRTPAATLVAGPDGAGVPNYIGTQPVKLVLQGLEDGATVVVKDDEGTVAFRGPVAPGASQELALVPPFTVAVKDAGAVKVSLDGADQGVIDGATAQRSRTFQPKG